MHCKEKIGVSGFEHIGSILNRVLIDIVSNLPPVSRADAIEALAERGIRDDVIAETVSRLDARLNELPADLRAEVWGGIALTLAARLDTEQTGIEI